jgi:acid stress chaperone HdeB
MAGIETIGFSIRARFDNFICDAVHSAVKLRPARFDTACACTGCSDFGCARSAENVLARFFGNHMHHTQAVCLRRLCLTPMELIMKTTASILFAAALVLASAPAHAVVLDLSTMTCKQFVEGGDDTIKMVLTWMDGWYKGDSDEAIIDTDVFVENAKKFGTYCGKNPTMSIVNAAEAVLGK